ncbi:MAG TPA: M20/M25/M40 family metallo-hydrolase, partial [Solirubrobacteraceae bacterium]|nr:M20/M25/M40 family metallo-hydrolase [Solirubrobacteraceae bacterium]
MIRPPARLLAALLAALLVAAAPLAAGTLHDPRETHLADVRQLTLEGDNAEAYWSSDGKRLIFQSTREPFGCDQIFTMPALERGAPALVSSGKGRTTCAYYLRGDRRVLYAGTDAYTESCPPPPDMSQGYVWRIDPDYELFVADPDGANRVRLTENRAYDAEATVCPRDGTVVFTSTRDGDLDLYRMNPDGSGVVRLTDTPGYDGGAFFSADCSKIVWRASRPRGAELEEYRDLLAHGLVRPSRLELWVANADGTDARQVTDLGVASFAPYFFPDGRRILFSSNYGDPRGREFDLWAVDVTGARLERITWTAGFDGFPIFSPDGRWLAFASNRNQARPGETDIFVARWVDGPAEEIVERGADRFLADDAWLADDAREGREAGTPGADAAAAWLERRFGELGLAPAAAGATWRQEFPITVAIRSGAGTQLAIEGEDEARSDQGRDEGGDERPSLAGKSGTEKAEGAAGVAAAAPAPPPPAGAPDSSASTPAGEPVPADQFVPLAFSSQGEVAGEVVAAGFGIEAPDQGVDAYAGLDVKGKIVLVRRFVPAGDAFKDPEVERRFSDLRYKAFVAREHGAAGLLVADLPDPAAETQDEAPLPKLAPEDAGDAGIPALAIRRALAERLLAAPHRVRLAVHLERDTAPGYNVVGRLDPAPGAAAADGRTIVVGAHYDHLGHGGPSSLDPGSTEVHNGADDNASGVAAMLEVARELASERERLTRPVVFVAFSGEEKGDLGSSAFVRTPPPGLEPERIAAMVNLDMVGRLRGQALTVFGLDSAEEWRSIVEPACAAAGLACHEQGDGYGPSDQTPFYAAGVPVLFLFTGPHGDYHRPSDDWQSLNATGGYAVASLATAFVRDVEARTAPLTP